jgi:hypothetical protein
MFPALAFLLQAISVSAAPRPAAAKYLARNFMESSNGNRGRAAAGSTPCLSLIINVHALDLMLSPL